MEKELSYELNKISLQIENAQFERCKLNEEIQVCERFFNENLNVIEELREVWREGEMRSVISDVETDVRKNQEQLLDELYNEKQELDRKVRRLEDDVENLHWHREKIRKVQL